MANEFSVSTSNLTSAASDLEQLNSQFKSLVEEMTETEASLSSMWEGEARDSFNKVFNEDKVQMDEFAALISKYATSLTNIADRYSEAERINTETASTRSV